jgi:hypothetical protein
VVRSVWKGVDDAVFGDNRHRFKRLFASILVSDVLFTTAVWSGRQLTELLPI